VSRRRARPQEVAYPEDPEEALTLLHPGRVLYLPRGRDLELTARMDAPHAWEVWYGRGGASYARRSDGATLRSSHRYQAATGLPHREAAELWVAWLAALQIPPAAGIAALVEALAPQLRQWKIDRREGEVWRQRLCLAGRAEVLHLEVEAPVAVYDLASAYPWAYAQALPGELETAARRDLPAHDCCAAHCDLEVPDSDLPPLPLAGGSGGVAWPTGRWTGWLAGPEAHLAAELDVIRRVHRVVTWTRHNPLTYYAEYLYSLRREAPDKATEGLVKLLLNSCYGLLASHSEGRVVYLRPPSPPPGALPLREGQWVATPRTRPGIYHPLAAAILTSRVRERLYRAAAACREALYLGVDGFHTHLGDPGAPALGEGVGQWRAEGPWLGGGLYLAPGRYLLRGHSALGDRIRHQGLDRPEAVEDLARYGRTSILVEGDPLAGLPGGLRELTWEPREGGWIGSRRIAGDRTRAPSAEEWQEATRKVPDLSWVH